MFPQAFGKYVLERELSRGGMARVLLATLRGAGGFEKKLVVKQIREELCFDEQFVSRFVEEAKTTVALSHPNIVPVYELGVEQGTYFLAMELVEGVTVHELLKGGEGRARRLTPEQGAYIGVEVCRALDYAHRRMQVVHRDVTPRNVMVDEEGQVKVIDFGIAAPARVAGHEVFGSPGHMPPEQVDGHELGPPTDLFAVAVLLMEAWSGSPPFRRSSSSECDAAMHAAHPRPSEIDPKLAPLDEPILRAMSLDPKERPQQAEDLGRALRKFLAGVDSADVARDLGAHVRAARKAIAKKRAKALQGGPQWKPSQPSVADLGPRTFAAREEVGRWKHTTPSPFAPLPLAEIVPAGDSGPDTRKMASDAPPRDDRVETIATRPLETPVGGPAKDSTPPLAQRRRAIWIAAAAALAVAGAFVVVRAGTGVAKPAPPPPTATVTASPMPSPSPTPTPSQAPAPVPSPAAPQAALPSSSSTPAPAGKGHLALFGDPGTLVAVDGTARGPVPLRDVALEPGPHDVLFTFEPTGERRGDRITLQAGERVRLRADFAGAIPTIRVER